METIEQLLSRPLPSILFATDNVNLQLNSHLDKCPRNFKTSPIDAEDLGHWKEFTKNVKDTLNKTDLSRKLIATRTESSEESGETIVVGNRYSLANRFQANVGAVLGAVFNTSADDEGLRDLRFGDSRVLHHCAGDDGYDGDADIMIMKSPLLQTSSVECRVVGVFDVFWNPDYRYMGGLKASEIDITDPIKFDDVEPTILQCFYYMGTLGAGGGYRFHEGSNVTGDSPHDEEEEEEGEGEEEEGDTPPIEPPPPITTATTLQEKTPPLRLKDLTPKSIIFGENGISQHLFQIQKDLYEYSENHKKKIFVGTLNGIDHECIAKYFPVDLVERYTHEKNSYLLLPPSRYFAKMLAFGDIILSGKYRNGHIIVFTKEKGVTLDYQMIKKMSQEEKTLIRQEAISATKILRSIGIKHGDPGPDNVLWDKQSGKLVMLDLEITWEEDRNRPADEWEVNMILGTELAGKGY
ncbi:hypothetical protein AOL_s00043g625 [Orbilia oligospora ATCC 24927]|uniref:Protein kinase domain-containing protein n=1 Tax=Arthrobotrys oligospora (strain ATCC 24927 / CBS 115.81 / DSM 1491) TaxID=756982 RepID=G1X4K1_ARTOA|nr:hypothetical protein AOL_s00043g625 [Orbilia oligospora ATCC 24927]EGX51891.1 hypothetical protein AOL_s00043g625 [Orbilia oligospora ATCC 24927]